MAANPPRPTLSVDDVALRYGLDTAHVRKLARRGALPAYKLGGLWRFDESDVEAWIESCRATPVSSRS